MLAKQSQGGPKHNDYHYRHRPGGSQCWGRSRWSGAETTIV